jgi:hypothetical protein
MIGGHGRVSDVGITTLKCHDHVVLDADCNLDVMKAKVTTLSAIDIRGHPGLPLLVTSNIVFEEDASFQKDITLEGNLLAGSTQLINIEGNVNISKNMAVSGLIVAGSDVLVHRDLFVTRDIYLEGTLTVLTDLYVNKNAIIEGNLTVYGATNTTGNVCMGNLKVNDLYVHTIHGYSPVTFNDFASFGKGANFKQLVQMVSADLEATQGAKIRIKDGILGGKIECLEKSTITMDQGLFHNMGGNVMITRFPASDGGKLTLEGGDHIVMGGNIMVSDDNGTGGAIHVMGGNLVVTGHSLTGKGSIAVLDGGDINLRNGGSMTINDGGNVVINNGGNIILSGGTLVMGGETLHFPIPEIQGGTNQTTFATGDMLYASATDTISKLAISADGQVMTIVSGLPAWGPPPMGGGGTVTTVTAGTGLSVGAGPGGMITTTGTLNLAVPVTAANGGTGQVSYATGDLLYASGATALSKRAIGTTGQILTVTGGLPIWANSSAALLSIGTILASMLTEPQFQALNGVGWILMDGRNVVGSAYNVLTGFATVPDARGTVLRGKNNGRADGFQNPSGELALGTFQNDQYQGHYHQNDSNANGGAEGFAGGGDIGNGWNITTYATTSVTDGVNGAPRTGAETRVKCITINQFIKIN